jgi:Raf kinase inhibitor-like YbhB/YbcL family protein
MDFQLTSTAFEEGRPIPRKYSGEGQNVSPPLKWTDPPPGTRSFALVCEDPDAPRGTFTHWVAFNLPAVSREVSEAVPAEEGEANGMRQGTNDFGKVGYGGPKPPPGKPHRYVFKLFALDTRIDLPAAVKKDKLLAALRGHVRGEAQLVGTYVHGQQEGVPTDPFEKKRLEDRESFNTAPLS